MTSLVILPCLHGLSLPWQYLISSVFKGVKEARLGARRPKSAPRRPKKCELHGRRMASTLRRYIGVKAYAFSASSEDAYASQDGYVALKK